MRLVDNRFITIYKSSRPFWFVMWRVPFRVHLGHYEIVFQLYHLQRLWLCAPCLLILAMSPELRQMYRKDAERMGNRVMQSRCDWVLTRLYTDWLKELADAAGRPLD